MYGSLASPCAYRLRFAAAAFGLLAMHVGALAEDASAKPPSKRKMFDFTPPRPGEMLATPAKGGGSPPQLKEFAPSAALHLSQNETDASGASPNGTQASDGAGKPRPASAGPAMQLSQAQKQIGEQIAKSGIDGFVAGPPQPGSPQEQQYWESVRKQISTSLVTWQALYAAPGAKTPPAPPEVTAPPAAPAAAGAPASGSGPKR